MEQQSAPRFMTVTEVADIMRVSKMTVYRLIHSGEMPAIRVGKSFRVPEAAVAQMIQAGMADHSGGQARVIGGEYRHDVPAPGTHHQPAVVPLPPTLRGRNPMGSVIKKRRKRMAKKKHRKLLRKTRHQRRNKK